MDNPEHDEACRVPEGRYANYFRVGHNAFEFVIDFAQMYHDTQNLSISARIVMSPAHAKGLLCLLRKSIDEYEATFGWMERGEEPSDREVG